MNPALVVGPPANAGQRSALTEILSQCFRATAADIEGGAQRVGDDNLRVVADGEQVLGGLWLLPMGQFYGGRSVPNVGIAAVGTDPAQRGRRAAGTLMAGAMVELAQRGVALSTLYPATLPLYRGAGFELAGSRYKVSLPLDSLDVRATLPPLRPAGPVDFEAMEDCYRRFARERNGYLDRCPYIWHRVREPKAGTARHFVVEEDGRIEGQLSMLQIDGESGAFYDLSLTDAVATTPGAARRLLAFLSSHASMAGTVDFHGGALHPLLSLVPEWRATVTLAMPWMLRIVDLDAALTARGYPAGLSAELQLEITDELLPANAGRRTLLVEDGVGRVERGGQGSLALDVRGLAALYTGRAGPDDLRLAGLLDGPPDERALAKAVFAGSPPAMADMF